MARELGPLLMEPHPPAALLEVGSFDVNSGLRDWVQALAPLQRTFYHGVDIVPGPGVDQVCRAEDLLARFGSEIWDVVVATELLEHVEDWREVVRNLVGVLVVSGDLLITTRSRGYGYHPFPIDTWRYEFEDMAAICAAHDLEVVALESDPDQPGVFLHARRRRGWTWAEATTNLLEQRLAGVELYRMPVPPDANVRSPAALSMRGCRRPSAN